MFSSKDIYTRMCHQSDVVYKMTDEERLKLQAHLRKMYKDIEAVCEKHGITMMIGGGNMLGQVRHGGFIPWDDDMDLYMPRKDYERFMRECYKDLPPHYQVYSPISENGPLIGFGKVIDTKTTFLFPGQDEYSKGGGIFIDILPLENIDPANHFNKFRRILTLGCIYLAGCADQFNSKSDSYRKIMSGCREGKINYWIRQVIGFFASVVSYSKWMKWEDKIVQCNKETDWFIRPMGTYDWSPQPKSAYLPVKKGKFDDIEVHIVNNPELFLDINYGDWHKIPKPSERWEHFIMKIDFEKGIIGNGSQQ